MKTKILIISLLIALVQGTSAQSIQLKGATRWEKNGNVFLLGTELMAAGKDFNDDFRSASIPWFLPNAMLEYVTPNPRWSIYGSYRYVNRDYFKIDPVKFNMFETGINRYILNKRYPEYNLIFNTSFTSNPLYEFNRGADNELIPNILDWGINFRFGAQALLGESEKIFFSIRAGTLVTPEENEKMHFIANVGVKYSLFKNAYSNNLVYPPKYSKPKRKRLILKTSKQETPKVKSSRKSIPCRKLRN